MANPSYDSNGNLLTWQHPKGNPTTYTYDARNGLIAVTDALGDKTELTYDPAGNLAEVTGWVPTRMDPSGATNFGRNGFNCACKRHARLVHHHL